MIPISILDLAPIRQGSDAAQAFSIMREQARCAEQLGYNRYWLAEHHNIDGNGSSATSVLIGHVAAATKTLRVGSGGIILPNHAPLAIAEQFGTLESLYPGRIDLGLGRTSGTDPTTSLTLRRGIAGLPERFSQDLVELQSYFRAPEPGQAVRAVPGAGLRVPIWLLGSSPSSAQLAARLGLPYAFAAHLGSSHLMGALRAYRQQFQPSQYLDRSYAMVGINVVAADSDDEARHLFTSMQIRSAQMMRGQQGPLSPPIDHIETYWSPREKAAIERGMRYAFVGSAETIRRGLADLLAQTGADELIATAHIFDPRAALRSLEILSAIRPELSSSSFARVLMEGRGIARRQPSQPQAHSRR